MLDKVHNLFQRINILVLQLQGNGCLVLVADSFQIRDITEQRVIGAILLSAEPNKQFYNGQVEYGFRIDDKGCTLAFQAGSEVRLFGRRVGGLSGILIQQLVIGGVHLFVSYAEEYVDSA